MVKNLPAIQETQAQSLGQKDPVEKGMTTHCSILAWESHGQRSLVGYNRWDRNESDKTDRLNTLHYIQKQSSPFYVPFLKTISEL